MKLNAKLRALREAAGLTQLGLARRASVPLANIRNYEQGKRQPGWAVLMRLVRALAVSADEFVDCDEVFGFLPARPRGRRPRR
jgi:transcriptional regulator with XRE-family HTH domain